MTQCLPYLKFVWLPTKGTYIDCKSPGLSGRILQYNRDANVKSEPFISHQAKYGSPGLFPIVHLDKKSVPIRRLPRESVTVRLVSTHEPSNYSINNGLLHDTESPDVSTSSVLKALREISKKRVLSEDIVLPQNKRQRNNYQTVVAEVHNGVNSLTNNRNESSNKLDDIPCVVDALAASLTSSNTSLVNSRNLAKRKVSESNLNLSPPKVPKHVSVEVQTQTENLKVSHNTQTTEELIVVSEVATISTAEVAIDSSAFRSTLKGKLSGRLTDFVGEESMLMPTSILSSPDKPKHDKHVTFNIPDTVEKLDVEVVTPKISIPVTAASSAVITSTATAVAQSLAIEFSASPSLITDPAPPIVCTTQADVTSTSRSTSHSTSNAATSLQLSFTQSSVITPTFSLPSSVGPKMNYSSPQATSSTTTGFSNTPNTISNLFGTSTSLPIVTSTIFSPIPNIEPKPLEDKFKATTTPIETEFVSYKEQKTLPQKAEVPITFTTPSKPGGFKFDLENPSTQRISSHNSTKAEPSFSFGKSNVGANVNFGANTTVTSAFGTSAISSTGFESKSMSSDGMSEIKPVAMQPFSFVSPSNSTAVLPQQTTSSLFPYESVVTTTVSSSILSPMSVTPGQVPNNVNPFKFDASAATAHATFAVPAFTTATADNSNNTFKFEAPTFNPAALKNTTQPTNNMTSFKFAAATTAPSHNTSTFSAVKPSNETSVFQFSPPNSTVTAPPPSDLFKFGGTTTNNPGLPTESGTSLFKFGGSTTSNAPALPGSEPNAFKFNNSNTNAVPLVSNGPPAFKFGGSSTNAVNTQPLNETGGFKFGNSTGGTSIVQPTLDSAFKFNASTITPSTTAPSLFTKPTFNPSSPPQNEQNIFKFGGSSLVTTAAATLFNAPAFNFTSPADTSSAVTAAPPSFPASGFNQFSSFESKPVNPFNTPGFRDGKTTVSFGAESKPTSVFGAPSQNENVFGSFKNTNQTNTFGVASPPTQPPFGTPAPSTQSAPAQPFQFGGPSNSQPGIFTFGANSERAQPAPGIFSFNAATTNNGFGSPPAPTFGTAPTTNNFTMPPPNYGSGIQPVPMFSIGTGSTASKPRTQLKARRRT